MDLNNHIKSKSRFRQDLITDRSMNIKVFNDILQDFEKQLKDTCKYFTPESIIELKTDIISMWLADCSMQFRK